MKYVGPIVAVGAVGIVGYFVYKATSHPTNASSDYCSGDWTDYVNPACWIGGLTSSASNAEATISNELNTVLLIIGAIVVIVIALLAFGPQTGHIARGVSGLAL